MPREIVKFQNDSSVLGLESFHADWKTEDSRNYVSTVFFGNSFIDI